MSEAVPGSSINSGHVRRGLTGSKVAQVAEGFLGVPGASGGPGAGFNRRVRSVRSDLKVGGGGKTKRRHCASAALEGLGPVSEDTSARRARTGSGACAPRTTTAPRPCSTWQCSPW